MFQFRKSVEGIIFGKYHNRKRIYVMISEIPKTFRATITDRFISAFFKGKGDVMIQVELLFKSSRLNDEILRRAFDLALDTEPILGCRLVKEKKTVKWERIENNKRNNFSICHTEKHYRSALRESVDPWEGPVLRGILFHGDDGDRLLFKVAHEVADASGAKDTVALVATLYRHLLRSPDYMLAPNSKSYRSARQLFKWFPKRTVPFVWLNALIELVPLIVWKKSCNPFSAQTTPENKEHLTRKIDKDTVSHMKLFGSRYGATLNDLLLTAFLRTLRKKSILVSGYLRCGFSVDLRKWYLPGGKADTIANLSSIEILHYGKKSELSFERTLKQVIRYTAKRKRRWIGLNLHLGLFNLFRTWSYDKMERVFGRQKEKEIHDMAVFPVFTNLGELDGKLVSFGTEPDEAHVLVPAAYTPYFVLGMSSYNGALTINAAAFKDTRETVLSFMDDMVRQLHTLNNAKPA